MDCIVKVDNFIPKQEWHTSLKGLTYPSTTLLSLSPVASITPQAIGNRCDHAQTNVQQNDLCNSVLRCLKYM